MPLAELDSEPICMTVEEQARLQEATPSSFAGHAPVLRLKLNQVRCCIYPEPLFKLGESSRSLQNGNDVASLVSQGTIWITDDQVSFLPTSGKGFALDYPSLSLHAISRSIPDSLHSFLVASTADSIAPGCLYCQLESSETEDDEQTVFPELWILPPEQDLLEPLFEALSYCASLHPSRTDGEDDGVGHPFAEIGPFGTGGMDGAASDGAFDDAAEEAEDGAQAAAGLSDTGRATLARLDSLLGQQDEQNFNTKMYAAPQSSTSTSSHFADPRKLAQEAAKASNSLILVHVPKEVFTHPPLAASLLDLLHAYGNLASWSPLPSFSRALIVYEEVEGAQRAKEALDRLSLPLIDEESTNEQIFDENATVQDSSRDTVDDASDIILRAFYGPMMATIPIGEDDEEKHLAVPTTDRNFLISPPGSPPVGWEPIKEDPPNRETLADDLIRALGSLRDKGLGVHGHQPKDLMSDNANDQKIERDLPPPSLVIPPSEAVVSARHPLAKGSDGGIISIPGVIVQSMDSDTGEDTLDKRMNKGMSISSVKATVESMKGPFTPSNANIRITPTGRPPLA